MSKPAQLSVLVPCYCLVGSKDHLLVKVFRDSLLAAGVKVVCDPNEFWNPSRRYDIIHYQWPDAIIVGMGLSRESLSAVKGRIAQFKREDMKFVITRHNEHKHYGASPLWDDLYKIVESSCDIILHMGRYSRDTMPADHCGDKARHFIVPLPTYPDIDRTVEKEDARRALGFGDRDKIVLAFGDFRSDEERVMVLSSMKKLRKDKVKLVAPRLFNSPIRGRGKVQAYRELRNRLRFLRYGLLLGNYGQVTNKLLSLQFAASDVVLIQRKKVLNSGNLPMGFYFGKVVVGPDRGNVGEILRETGNPVFDPEDTESVASAINCGLDLAKKGKGLENRTFADARWRPDIVAKSIVDVYEQLLAAPSNQE